MNLNALRSGQQLPAGCGSAQVLPDFDFETYSSAGYLWSDADNKWVSITKSPPHGLPAVGAAAYSEHPSTEVLSLAYDFKDGLGPRMWVPGMQPPTDLFDHIASGGLLEACNSAFEWYIWKNVCEPMGWPPLPFEQLRDVAAKARAFSLPGALGKMAEVLQLDDQKIADGKRLINKFSKPRKPTKKDPRRRIKPEEDHEDAVKFYDYNRGDIRSESAASALIPDLSTAELNLWLLDQGINYRGVHIDPEALADCIAVVEEAHARYTAELVAITGGVVKSAGEIGKLSGWLGANGVHMDSLDSAHVAAALERDDLPPAAKRVLEIRASLGAASVKKLFAMDRRVSKDGRLRDLFAFCGADRTGRFAGRGPQPQNLPNSGPLKVWGVAQVDHALSVIASRDLLTVEGEYGDAVAAVSGCLRGLFSAPNGYDLIASDYSAIEAVVLAQLAGEQWRIEVFKTHGMIYEMSASKITGIPFEEFISHKKETGEHHPLRKKVGKIAELACFGPGTQVLTKRGYVDIVGVTSEDYLWDGIEWVQSYGSIHKGARGTINVDGIDVTPDHPISLGRSWKAAKKLASNENTLRLALAIGSENLPSCETLNTGVHTERSSNAPAEKNPISLRTLTSTWAKLPAVGIVGVVKGGRPISKNTLRTLMPSPTLRTEGGFAIDLAPQSAGATTQEIGLLKTMEVVGYTCATSGGRLRDLFSPMLRACRGGMTRALTWIGSTPTVGTPRGISDLSLDLKTQKTKGRSSLYKKEWTNSRDVYDIVNAGPRNRFTIKTDSGHLIVHNSGYRGAIGAWKAFGAGDFMEDDEIKESVKAWRKESPAIVDLWYGLERAAFQAVEHPGECFSYRDITYGVKDDVLYCLLPSGRSLAYHNPRLLMRVMPWGKEVLQLTYMAWNSDYTKGPMGWTRLDTHGGKLCENVCQAVARDILTHAMPALDAAGYPIVLHVHDEIVSEVPKGFGSVDEFETIMATMPAWASDWPIKAAGGWRGKRYRKG